MTSQADDAGASDRAFALLQELLPQHLLSRTMHRLARSETPWVRNAILRTVLRAYPQIDLAEAANPDPFAYASFNAFFTRALRPGVRPLAGGERDLVSPVDGTMSQLGTVRDGQLLQAKGMHYTASGPSSVSNSHTTRSLRANSPGITRAVAALTLNSWPGT